MERVEAVRLDAAAGIGYTGAMISVKTRTHIGPDGTLTLEVSTPLRETDVEVMVVLQPLVASEPGPESLGWPPGFFDRTFGSLRDDPLGRLPQGEYELREAIE